jgi:hypothetical protein
MIGTWKNKNEIDPFFARASINFMNLLLGTYNYSQLIHNYLNFVSKCNQLAFLGLQVPSEL